MPDRTDVTLAEAAKLADLIRREAEYEQGEIADKEAKQEMGLMSDKPDKHPAAMQIDAAMATLEKAQRNMSDQPDKNPVASWQVWAAGIIAFLTKLVDEAWIQQHPEAVLWIGYAIAALILALRIKTRVPLRWKVKP